jgi:hypothetical protein
MNRTVRLGGLGTVLSALEYPITRPVAASACADTVLELADGEVNLGETIRASMAADFATVEDLELEVMGLLPRHAVGEPFQSEGDA